MVGALDQRAVPPGRERTPRKPKKMMPEGPGIHKVITTFGGEVAERGREKIPDLETDGKFVARRSTPPPAPGKEDYERPTYNPDPNEIKGQKLRALREHSARSIEKVSQDDMPTCKPPGFKKPRNKKSREEQLLSRDSDVSRLTTSFAPPSPIPSAITEENIATELKDNVVPIAVAKGWVPPRKRKQQEETKRPSIVPTRGSGWSLEEAVQDSLVMPHANCGPGSK